MPESVPRWAPPPLSPFAGPGERALRRQEEARLVQEIAWIWKALCSGTGLIQRVVPTGYASWEVPRLGPVALGPPTRFSVELRPGQLRDDFVAVRRRIASAYGVDDVDVFDLVRGWITVELIERGPEPARPGTVELERSPESRPQPITRHGPRLPPRGRRGPAGGPQSLR